MSKKDDRLSEIKRCLETGDAPYFTVNDSVRSDSLWLVQEVERLREVTQLTEEELRWLEDMTLDLAEVFNDPQARAVAPKLNRMILDAVLATEATP